MVILIFLFLLSLPLLFGATVSLAWPQVPGWFLVAGFFWLGWVATAFV